MQAILPILSSLLPVLPEALEAGTEILGSLAPLAGNLLNPNKSMKAKMSRQGYSNKIQKPRRVQRWVHSNIRRDQGRRGRRYQDEEDQDEEEYQDEEDQDEDY
jgi:hypothetical protein